MIKMIQTYVIAIILEKFSMTEDVQALYVFVEIIYTMIPKLLATMLTIV